MLRKTGKAQSVLEYTMIICIVVSALMVMRLFMTRAFQEKFRKSADVFGDGEQYENTGPDRTSVTTF